MTDVKYGFEFAYGPGSAALPGHVMMRMTQDDKPIAEFNIVPDYFLGLAHSMENIARAVADDLEGKKD